MNNTQAEKCGVSIKFALKGISLFAHSLPGLPRRSKGGSLHQTIATGEEKEEEAISPLNS